MWKYIPSGSAILFVIFAIIECANYNQIKISATLFGIYALLVGIIILADYLINKNTIVLLSKKEKFDGDGMKPECYRIAGKKSGQSAADLLSNEVNNRTKTHVSFEKFVKQSDSSRANWGRNGRQLYV